jgi:hypothetical protein
MKIFLAIAAILAWLFGAGLLLAPAKFYEPIGITYTPILGTVAQAHGATLFGLGVITWLARGADRQGLMAVLGGSLVVQILSLLVALRVMSLGAGASATPSIVIHVVLGAVFAYFLIKTRRTPARPA